MRFTDLAAMAWHNLYSRKLRTALNLFGVVLGCVVLAMTFAGTRGVERGFRDIIDNAEDARKFMIQRSYEPDVEPPEEVLLVSGEMSEERRERIRQRLKEKWLGEHAERTVLAKDQIAELKRIPHLIEVVPESHLACFLIPQWDQKRESRAGSAIGISTFDSVIKSRVIFGEPLQADDREGILLSEFAAYEFGFQSDEQLRSLIGKQLNLEFRIAGQRFASILQYAAGARQENTEIDQTLSAIEKLVENVDATPLTPEQKQRVREAFSLLNLSGQNEELIISKTCKIRGIFRAGDETDLISFIRTVYVNDRPDVYLPGDVATELAMTGDAFDSFWGAIGTVDKLSNLEQVTEDIKELGFETRSALMLMLWIERDISQNRLAISAISLLILVISAIGISNTMVVSVLERTSEFGILKALGARDRQILVLVMAEGAITGIFGALTAMAISIGISELIAIIVRQHIQQRIQMEFDARVFDFSMLDVALVLTVATTVCAVASLFPAYRAARLDPVVAMRKN